MLKSKEQKEHNISAKCYKYINKVLPYVDYVNKP